MTSEEFIKRDKKTTRNAAIVIGFSVAISIFLLLYSYVQPRTGRRVEHDRDAITERIKQCPPGA